MRKALFAGFAGLSLILCIATVVLWVRSYWVTDLLQHFDGGRSQDIISVAGQVLLRAHGVTLVPQPTGISFRWFHQATASHVSMPSFHFQRDPLAVVVPHWFLALLASVLPILWFITFRRAHRHQPGLCPKCGYDLRASKERCPECGTLISSPAPSPPERGDQTRD